MLQSLFGLQFPLTHNPFNKVRGIFFLRTVSSRLYCVDCVSVYSCICIMWLYNTLNNLQMLYAIKLKPKMPFKVMHRKEVIHSNGSYERKSRERKLADEMGRGKKIPMVPS